MDCPETSSLEEVLDQIYNALGNSVRRRIIEVLAATPCSYKDLMRACGIRDSSTLNYHLSKLGMLIEKGPDGLYRLTRLGALAYEMNKAFSDRLSITLPAIKGNGPIIVLKPDPRALSTTLLIIIVIISMIFYYISLFIKGLNEQIAIITALSITAIMAAKIVLIASTRYFMKPSNIIIKVNIGFYNKIKYIHGKILDITVSESIITKLFNTTTLIITMKCEGGIINIKIPYISKKNADAIKELMYTIMTHT